MMDSELEKLYEGLEAAARLVWDTADKRRWIKPDRCDCDDCKALMTVSEKLAALAAYRDAHPAGYHCETWRTWGDGAKEDRKVEEWMNGD